MHIITQRGMFGVPASKKILQAVATFMTKADNMKFYNLVDLVNRKIGIVSNNSLYLDIALVDNFDDKIELDNLE